MNRVPCASKYQVIQAHKCAYGQKGLHCRESFVKCSACCKPFAKEKKLDAHKHAKAKIKPLDKRS